MEVNFVGPCKSPRLLVGNSLYVTIKTRSEDAQQKVLGSYCVKLDQRSEDWKRKNTLAMKSSHQPVDLKGYVSYIYKELMIVKWLGIEALMFFC